MIQKLLKDFDPLTFNPFIFMLLATHFMMPITIWTLGNYQKENK